MYLSLSARLILAMRSLTFPLTASMSISATLAYRFDVDDHGDDERRTTLPERPWRVGVAGREAEVDGVLDINLHCQVFIFKHTYNNSIRAIS
jgi:hypothetical protein